MSTATAWLGASAESIEGNADPLTDTVATAGNVPVENGATETWLTADSLDSVPKAKGRRWGNCRSREVQLPATIDEQQGSRAAVEDEQTPNSVDLSPSAWLDSERTPPQTYSMSPSDAAEAAEHILALVRKDDGVSINGKSIPESDELGSSAVKIEENEYISDEAILNAAFRERVMSDDSVRASFDGLVEFETESKVELPDLEYPENVQALIVKIERAVKCVKGAVVHAFGSAVNGFAEETSDIDLVLETTSDELQKGLGLGVVAKRDVVPRALAFLQKHLKREGLRVQDRVLGAKVPILKLRWGKKDCDLSCMNCLPVFNSRLLRAYVDIDPRVVELNHAAKRWAREQGVHGAPLGHLSSYGLTLMCIFYMQVRGAFPCLQRDVPEKANFYTEGGKTFNVSMDLVSKHLPKPDINISFKDFVLFFHTEFKWGEHVVSIRTGVLQAATSYASLRKECHTWISAEEGQELLHIEDPFDVGRNLNCVFAPGSNAKLWWAFEQAANRKPEAPLTHPFARIWKPGLIEKGTKYYEETSEAPPPVQRVVQFQ